MDTTTSPAAAFISAGAPPVPPPTASGMEITVPAAALAIADEQDQPTLPEQGDAVAAQIEGRVARVDGDRVVITVEKLNGEPVASTEPDMEPDLDAEGESLRRDLGGY